MDTGVVSGIRTHEANATDLKSVPFDHSGIRAEARKRIRIFIFLLFFNVYEFSLK